MANKSPRSHHVPIEMRRDRPLAKAYDGPALGSASSPLMFAALRSATSRGHSTRATTSRHQLQRSIARYRIDLTYTARSEVFLPGVLFFFTSAYCITLPCVIACDKRVIIDVKKRNSTKFSDRFESRKIRFVMNHFANRKN